MKVFRFGLCSSRSWRCWRSRLPSRRPRRRSRRRRCSIPAPRWRRWSKRAQAEGTLNFYTVPPDASVRRVVDAFTKRWGVKATWTRFGTAALQDRYGSESTAGNPGRRPDPRLELAVGRVRRAEGLDHRARRRPGIPGWPKRQGAGGLPAASS